VAKEISRTFDTKRGAVVLGIEDQFGSQSFHTIYVAGVPDFDARVAKLLADTDTQAAVIHAGLTAAGWKP
jgi:hypothetical protein